MLHTLYSSESFFFFTQLNNSTEYYLNKLCFSWGVYIFMSVYRRLLFVLYKFL